ncbi:DUF4080 domain-containing protein [Clostridium fermenticellae]|uniref:DUF4080 domain-containing protein n=1 Tax=Clostridium fermenticellae TaxID=2068654 RepID=A0A386H3K4_9CLOT|nr:B12-binding domain-containing radical SAM protein [Clostridium fermenticellae]AYD40272.1 DUF4080 domain-containing protein [Clostridium fermenticellae]
MKVILTAVNSKFIHSNLAVRYLKAYTKNLNYDCRIMEFTINDRIERIVEEIINKNPDMVAFSCYIWNIDYIKHIASLIKLINNDITVIYGGPEVSYDSKTFLYENPGEFVLFGEGEETYSELINWILIYGRLNNSTHEAIYELKNIKGLCFKVNGKVICNAKRPLMDMNDIVFPYDRDDDLSNKIVYYEASRGCPFNCKYCLSSTIHGVRFLNINRVKKELKFLIDKDVKLIKFVDRTFNCNPKFTMEIWNYLINIKTDATFHFEISADILTEEEIEIVSKAPRGRFQFEVGVQTTNDIILHNINRHVNFYDIKQKVDELERIGNVKQHLDLIAGLPGEDIASFKKSFNDIYLIRPEEIQLGFLKLLKGSSMRDETLKWGMVYSPYPPYEILKTKNMSYSDITILKRVEKVLDKYYNSRKFDNILNYFLPKFNSPFDFYYFLGKFFYEKGYLSRSISSVQYYKVFLELLNELTCNKDDKLNLKEIIKFDYLKYNKKKWLPEFLIRDRNKKEEVQVKNCVVESNIKLQENYHIEKFFIDIKDLILKNEINKKVCYIIFDEKSNIELYISELFDSVDVINS